MKITAIDSFPEELDELALRSPQATFYHSGVWLDGITAAYPAMSFRCLLAERDGAPVGYLPYFLTRRGPLKRLWSLPFGTYGGPVSLDDGVSRALLDAYRRLTSGAGVMDVGWVDFHDLSRVDAPTAWYETHLVDMTIGFDRVFSEKFATQRRRGTRRAEGCGVTVIRCVDPAGIHSYFEIFHDKIRGFGRDNLYTEALYERLFERGGDAVRLYLAYLGDHVVGGHLNFYYKDTVISWYGVVAAEHKRSQAGTALYTTCIREACDEGFSTYNLGASLGKQSLIHFKESLGGVAHRYPVHVARSLLGKLARRVRRTGGP